MSASPRVVDGVVIAQGAHRVSAFDLADGSLRWSALSEKMAYATPVLGKTLGDPTLVVSSAKRVIGLDPAMGARGGASAGAFLEGSPAPSP